MSQAVHAQPQTLPRAVLIGAGALITLTIAATLFARSAGVGEVRMPTIAAYDTLRLNFDDAADGAVLVRDASNGALIYRVEPGTNGFLRGALRGFAQERLRDGVGRAAPFTLTRWRDGTLSLQDQATGRRIDLDAFGPTQSADFAQLFAAKETVK